VGATVGRAGTPKGTDIVKPNAYKVLNYRNNADTCDLLHYNDWCGRSKSYLNFIIITIGPASDHTDFLLYLFEMTSDKRIAL